MCDVKVNKHDRKGEGAMSVNLLMFTWGRWKLCLLSISKLCLHPQPSSSFSLTHNHHYLVVLLIKDQFNIITLLRQSNTKVFMQNNDYSKKHFGRPNARTDERTNGRTNERTE